ncbi:hypothetical protein EXS72_00605 [Candidatus Pacearchaeota archaeon]|nr:hypothetical protein [Candidatus Pacearchaeota archaeon]
MIDSKKCYVQIIGIVFLIFGIGAIVNTLTHINDGLAPIIWFSYIGLILLAVGCFRRDGSLIASQLCILIIPYLIWNIDFFTYLFSSYSIWGTADYIFDSGDLFGKIISLQHIFNIPLSLFALYLIGLKRKDFWKISFFEIVILFFVSRFTTNYEQNVNCVYHNCASFDLGILYPLWWFLGYGVMIALTSFVLVKIFTKR